MKRAILSLTVLALGLVALGLHEAMHEHEHGGAGTANGQDCALCMVCSQPRAMTDRLPDVPTGLASAQASAPPAPVAPTCVPRRLCAGPRAPPARG